MRRLVPLALVALPFPAFAQQDQPLCGGISLVGEWFGGAESASDPAIAGGPLDADGMVPVAGHLVRMFTLADQTPVRVEVVGTTGGDPYFSVVDANGSEVAADDDSGGNFSARSDVTLAAGTYCVAARSYSGGMTPVTIRVGLQEHEPLTGESETDTPAAAPQPDSAAVAGGACGTTDTVTLGDGLTAAALAGDGISLSASAAAAPGRSFTLAEDTPLTITATADAADPVIRLLDEAGTQLAENDDFEGLDSRIDMVDGLAAGSYCVEVEDLNTSGNPITVSLFAFDAAAERLSRLNAAEITPSPEDDVPIVDLGVLQSTTLRDVDATGAATWISFTLPEGGLVVAEAVAADVDPTIRLFDRLGRLVGENDDGPQGLDSFLALRLQAGDYVMALRLVDQSSSGTVRVLLERYVPAQ